MPTYQEVVAIVTLKFANHSAEQCEFALKDIHATLAAQGGSIEAIYEAKLYAELDACRARQMHLREIRARAERRKSTARELRTALENLAAQYLETPGAYTKAGAEARRVLQRTEGLDL